VAHPRTLALDVGDRRIGIAITDPLGVVAQPLFTLHRSTPKPNLRSDLKAIARFVRQHNVQVIVIGNPLHADGSLSPQAEKTQAFAADPTLTFHLFDERLTTHDAHALLGSHSGYADRRSRSEVIDQVAATILLDAFLSSGNPNLLPDPDADLV
jgi:putative Holliday junction resolvase